MLKHPSVLMLNCLGSYFYSIFDSVGLGPTLLYYLSLGHLSYHSLNLQKVQQSYADNSWGYQPVSIVNSNQQTIGIDDDFFQYLLNNFNVDIKSIDMNIESNLLKYINGPQNKQIFYICNVDEFYIPSSTSFYHKQHNKHFLLIKAINDGIIEVIDSERNNTYTITCEEMEQAVYSSVYRKKSLYVVDISLLKNKTDYEAVLKNLLLLERDTNYIEQLIDDININLSKAYDNQTYFFKGYYYTILSKILPYFTMIYYVLLKNNSSLSDGARDLMNQWKNLCNFMRFQVYKNNLNLYSVKVKLETILIKEIEFDKALYHLKSALLIEKGGILI